MKSARVALITGITGQDGSYLAEFLIEKGYQVFGIMRRSSVYNTERIDSIFSNPNLHLYHGDMTDSSNLLHVISEMTKKYPINAAETYYEVYNLAAQSHVKVSFELPLYTGQVDAIGTLNLLEAIRCVGILDHTRFYQASTSEMFGKVQETPQKETTPFYPRSPYGVAKLYAYWMVKNYREAYGLFACNGILFNHESQRRGKTFVTRKITIGVGQIARGESECIELGNMDSKRDWTYAPDMVRAMWMMLQAPTATDYVASSGEQHSVREFAELAFKHIGMELEWQGVGLSEVGVEKSTGKVRVKMNERHFRPAEVESLLGDASKIEKELGWKPEVSFEQLVRIMVEHDLNP